VIRRECTNDTSRGTPEHREPVASSELTSMLSFTGAPRAFGRQTAKARGHVDGLFQLRIGEGGAQQRQDGFLALEHGGHHLPASGGHVDEGRPLVPGIGYRGHEPGFSEGVDDGLDVLAGDGARSCQARHGLIAIARERFHDRTLRSREVEGPMDVGGRRAELVKAPPDFAHPGDEQLVAPALPIVAFAWRGHDQSIERARRNMTMLLSISATKVAPYGVRATACAPTNGPGLALEAISRSSSAAHVTGIDHSTQMVERARKRLAASISEGRAEVLEADASRLPFEAGCFDRVLAVNSFAFWRDGMVRLKPDTTHVVSPGAIEGVLRVLKPGGRLVIVHQPGFVNIHAQFLPLSPIVAGIIAERPARQTGPNT